MTDAEIIADLIRVGTGRIKHADRGECPEVSASYDDADWRDQKCPACIAIMRAEGLLSRMRRNEPKP